MKLRLLLFKECNRKCSGCANKDWDLDALKVENDFSQYDEITLTGGEPMLRPKVIIDTVAKIRKVNPECVIYLYTAHTLNIDAWKYISQIVDGITVTLHNQKDVRRFILLEKSLGCTGKKMRLNVFKGINIDEIENTHLKYSREWTIRKNMEFIKDCPFPEDRFRRLEKL